MPRKKPPKPHGRRGRLHESAPRVRVSADDYAGNPWRSDRRPEYQLETLANALAKQVATRDPFLTPSIQATMGRAPLLSLTLDLISEGSHRLVFKLQAINARRKRGAFSLFVTKQSGKAVTIAQKEFGNLEELHRRAPNAVIEVLGSGRIHLPARGQRGGSGREIYAVITKSLGRFQPLAVAENHQFTEGVPPSLLSKDQTGAIRSAVFAMILRCYDEKSGEAPEPPRLDAGDVFVSWTSKGAARVRLTACRGMMRKLPPARLLHRLIGETQTIYGRDFHLAPRDPEQIIAAVVSGVGKTTAREWLSRYEEAITRGSLEPQNRFPLEVLEAVGLD